MLLCTIHELHGVQGVALLIDEIMEISDQNLSRQGALDHPGEVDGDVADDEMISAQALSGRLVIFVAASHMEAGSQVGDNGLGRFLRTQGIVGQHQHHQAIEVEVRIETLHIVPNVEPVPGRRLRDNDAQAVSFALLWAIFMEYDRLFSAVTCSSAV